jgi:hypothetical protein
MRRTTIFTLGRSLILPTCRSGSRATDSFIGWPSMIGRGHGHAYLRLLAERLCAEGAPLVAIDPAEDNFRARRAYEKAGLRLAGSAATEAGPVVLIVYEPDPPRVSSLLPRRL